MKRLLNPVLAVLAAACCSAASLAGATAPSLDEAIHRALRPIWNSA